MSATLLFPLSYSRWLSARLPGTVTETRATCETCAMEKPQGLTRDPGPFDPTLKCCTYFPFVPNFGVGLMLKENSAAIRLRLQIAEKQGVLLPMGLHAAPEYQARMAELGPTAFGNSRDLLCPFYDTARNGCSVWKNRPGVCATYFCKSDRGAQGLQFWKDVENYLNHFEWALASEVFARLGFSEEEMEMCKAAMSIEEPGEERDYFVRFAWGPWIDKKEEFFLAATEEAQKIGPGELTALLSDEALPLEESLRSRTP